MFKSIAVAIILLISGQSWAEKIYKWVDENGQIHYSSQKPNDQQAETVKVKKGPKVTPKAEAEPAAAQATDAGQTDAEQTETEAAADAAAEEAARKQLAEADRINNRKQCDLARKNYAALNATVRVTRRDANGQVVRMTDDERVNALKTAQQAIKQYCN